MRKKLWLWAGILAVSMTCTIHAEVMDLGGFQIQVGQKSDGVTGTAGQTVNDAKPPNGQMPGRETAAETPQETYQAPSSGGYTEQGQEQQTAGYTEAVSPPSETAVQEQGESLWTENGEALPADPQAQTDSWEEKTVYYEEVCQQPGGTQIQEEMTMQRQETANSEEQKTEGQETREAEENKKEQKTAGAAAEEEGQKGAEEAEHGQTKPVEKAAGRQEVQFIHGEGIRSEAEAVPSVRLKGEREVCVVSYAVNHWECACRWEGNQLLPVEPPLRKGLNCLEISVFTESGQVISMEPWYFTYGAGSAML